MYLEHFGLRELPFSLTPDTSYFLNRSGYQDALNVLLVALRSGEGFVKVVGEVGTGKTLLCRKLLNTLGDDFRSAYIHNPYLEPTALLHTIAVELGVERLDRDQHLLLNALAAQLLRLHGRGQRVVLCLDEVQATPIETLETLRLLTNLETEKRKLIQVVLFGQPELDRLLDEPSVRQLKQRITFAYRMLPMSRSSLNGYVSHRLMVAGAGGADGVLFEQPALDQIYRHSRGIPRVINVLCHKSLMVAFGRGRANVTRRCALDAIRDTTAITRSELRSWWHPSRWMSAEIRA